MTRILLLALIAALLATRAEAGPVGAAIAAIGKFLAGKTFLAIVARTVLSIGLSLLAQKLRGKPKVPGIVTETTTTGGITPQKFIVGRYATAGQLVAPPMSYGGNREWLVYVVALCVLPGATLRRVIINDEYWQPGDEAPIADWGQPSDGTFDSHAWIDYRDGSQTAAHPGLLAAFGSDPDRPWSSDMIGPGLCYAVCRFRYNRELFQGLPSVRFEMDGIPLYDPRGDSTVGGSGAQRWADPATWTQTANPAVIIYNILRGIRLPDGEVWGGRATAADLPLARWFAAMNECDVAIDIEGGGTVPQYRCGLEIAIDDEPAEVIEALLKTCSGQIVEMGGVWTLHVGPPALPVLWITDDDVIVSRPQELEPFPGISATWNGITATYPDPDSLWEPREAPARYDEDWETEDGGRRLVADLSLNACPWPEQVQRLMAAYIADERRFRRHRQPLPPEAAILEPLDTIGWSSTHNGYVAKLFEITSISDALTTLIQTVGLRERDPADYDWEAGDLIPSPPANVVTTPPAAQVVPGWAVSAGSVVDGAGADRRPSIVLTWDGDAASAARGLEWQLRLNGVTDVQLSGTTEATAAGLLVLTAGILPATAYQLRGRLIADLPTGWTDWSDVTTLAIGIATVDIAAGAVVRGGVAGSGAVTNNSATWTTVASFTMSSLPVGSFVQGTLSAVWSHAINTFPSDFQVRITVGGTVVGSFGRSVLINQTQAVGRLFVPFTRSGIPAGSFDVAFDIQNAGGQGVSNSNLQAIAVMR